MTASERIIEDISLFVIECVPQKEWEKIETTISATGGYKLFHCQYCYQNTFTSFALESSNYRLFTQNCKKLREIMYSLNNSRGTWYTINLEIDNSGKFKINFDYDNKPDLSFEIPDEVFIEDFEQFPRDEQYIPEWLREILVRHGKL